MNPFPGDDKRNLLRRAAGFVGFSALAGLSSLPGGRVDAVIAMSPPLTIGLTGWITHVVRRGPLIFNIQDVFPDAAVETGAITNRAIIAAGRWLERFSYGRAASITVLSADLRDNVAAKVPRARHDDVRVIPNFVDTDAISPRERMTELRNELGIGTETVVLYAGNVGFSQSLEMVVDAARAIPSLTFVINGDGAARAALQERAAGLSNVRFSGYQPLARLPEVLATGDIHLVPLKAGLGRVERAVEDVFDPRRRATGAGGDRRPTPRCRGSWPTPVGESACHPTIPATFRIALEQLAADRARARGDGRRRTAMGRAGGVAGRGCPGVRRSHRRVERGSLTRSFG